MFQATSEAVNLSCTTRQRRSAPRRGSKIWDETAEGGVPFSLRPDSQARCKRPAKTRRAIRTEEELRESRSGRTYTLRPAQICRAREQECPALPLSLDRRRTIVQKRSRAGSPTEREWQASAKRRAEECAIPPRQKPSRDYSDGEDEQQETNRVAVRCGVLVDRQQWDGLMDGVQRNCRRASSALISRSTAVSR